MNKQENQPTNATDGIVERVRERYSGIALGRSSGCCGSDVEEEALRVGYLEQDLEAVPGEANLGLGCGAPIEALGLMAGETVLDLGSGGGLDAFLAARRVGPSGRVIGVDMTAEMIERARAAAARAGLDSVEFREGRLEALPVDDDSVDAITSNCVINLVPDKASVFREAVRVLRPGGRLVVSDIILDGPLPAALERDVMAYVGCVAGAMQRAEYFEAVRAAGFGEVTILRDLDYLRSDGGSQLPEEAIASLAAEGVGLEVLAGKVRSVTFRAVKPTTE